MESNDKKSNFNFLIFKKPDVFIYLLTAIAIAIIFLFTVIKPQKSFYGFEVKINGSTLATYTFTNDSLTISDLGLAVDKISSNDEELKFKVYLNKEKTEYNVISISKVEKTARVIDSTCSSSKDCVYTSPIGDSGVIICAPHQLKIIALSDGFVPPIAG